MADGVGLRELKKQETRQEISDRATELFLERGFEETTIADIASAARVAKKTVTNYFARKEDLALDHHEVFTSGLARTVAEREPGESALAALRRVFAADVRRQDPVIGFSGMPFARMIADSPTLTARLRELNEQREESLAAVLAVETRAEPGDITARAVAAVLGGVHRVLFGDVVRFTLDGLGNDEIAERVGESGRRAFDLIEPALADYAVRAGE
ncbi:TetR/AcrR family transcriptional regulator [Rhodococcus sp. MTM3W5.2]|uniref:TetR/AcrR family transcriptional regulator n=1 Tax=Rhodococcus sp. MTM3W5.2 TaxID=1805827 RepID=UPI00097CADDE|nr:TetR/AcrR family transcriptional regulator [Rhodococcus sp. MTM3W5.2]